MNYIKINKMLKIISQQFDKLHLLGYLITKFCMIVCDDIYEWKTSTSATKKIKFQIIFSPLV